MGEMCKNEIKVDIRNETIENILNDLRFQISILKHQNLNIKLKLDEDVCFDEKL